MDTWPFYVPTEWGVKENPQKAAEWREKYKTRIQADARLRESNGEEVVAELLRRKKKIEDRFAGHRKVHRGIIAKHKAVEFRYSGAISYDLFDGKLGREKTVDVNLAVDMLQMRDAYDIAVVVSGDQDYLPAVHAVKNAGKTVVNVAFSARSGELLPGGAKRLNESADWSLTVDHKTLMEYMNLEKKAA
ncbi:MAG: NYN domain-containing protein [Gammaproteobacteria bacterium]